MKFRTGRRSSNVEDRRGTRMGGGRGRGMALKGGGIGTIILVLVAMYFGVDPSIFLQGGGGIGPTQQSTPYKPTAEEEKLAQFVSFVLADTEDTWKVLFKEQGMTYQPPKLVLFTGAVKSACGFAQAAVGPFYCPADKKVYIDLSFYRDMKNKLGAPGDFAQAYVISHEVAHHIQTLLGISGKVQQARQRASKSEGNKLSVMMELQADCLAGVWAHHADKARQVLEQGDIEEGINAASAIGDDRLQKQSTGYVSPDSFTHGSSAQRVRWFKRGIQQGKMQTCDTFNAASL